VSTAVGAVSEFTPVLLIELLLVFGSVAALTIWELVSLRRYRRRREEEQRKANPPPSG